LDGCDALSDVTPINHLAGLETLYLSGGKRLNDMVSLARLHGLRSLHWQTRGGLPTQLSVLSEVPMLEQMTLCGKTVEKISFETELSSLRYLDLSNCPDLVEIEGLPLLVTLETLKLNEWFPLSNLSLVRCLPKLRDVKLVATS
jgi:Leucine-rich repeat (LRR) protein